MKIYKNILLITMCFIVLSAMGSRRAPPPPPQWPAGVPRPAGMSTRQIPTILQPTAPSQQIVQPTPPPQSSIVPAQPPVQPPVIRPAMPPAPPPAPMFVQQIKQVQEQYTVLKSALNAKNAAQAQTALAVLENLVNSLPTQVRQFAETVLPADQYTPTLGKPTQADFFEKARKHIATFDQPTPAIPVPVAPTTSMPSTSTLTRLGVPVPPRPLTTIVEPGVAPTEQQIVPPSSAPARPAPVFNEALMFPSSLNGLPLNVAGFTKEMAGFDEVVSRLLRANEYEQAWEVLAKAIVSGKKMAIDLTRDEAIIPFFTLASMAHNFKNALKDAGIAVPRVLDAELQTIAAHVGVSLEDAGQPRSTVSTRAPASSPSTLPLPTPSPVRSWQYFGDPNLAQTPTKYDAFFREQRENVRRNVIDRILDGSWQEFLQNTITYQRPRLLEILEGDGRLRDPFRRNLVRLPIQDYLGDYLGHMTIPQNTEFLRTIVSSTTPIGKSRFLRLLSEVASSWLPTSDERQVIKSLLKEIVQNYKPIGTQGKPLALEEYENYLLNVINFFASTDALTDQALLNAQNKKEEPRLQEIIEGYAKLSDSELKNRIQKALYDYVDYAMHKLQMPNVIDDFIKRLYTLLTPNAFLKLKNDVLLPRINKSPNEFTSRALEETLKNIAEQEVAKAAELKAKSEEQKKLLKTNALLPTIATASIEDLLYIFSTLNAVSGRVIGETLQKLRSLDPKDDKGRADLLRELDKNISKDLMPGLKDVAITSFNRFPTNNALKTARNTFVQNIDRIINSTQGFSTLDDLRQKFNTIKQEIVQKTQQVMPAVQQPLTLISQEDEKKRQAAEEESKKIIQQAFTDFDINATELLTQKIFKTLFLENQGTLALALFIEVDRTGEVTYYFFDANSLGDASTNPITGSPVNNFFGVVMRVTPKPGKPLEGEIKSHVFGPYHSTSADQFKFLKKYPKDFAVIEKFDKTKNEAISLESFEELMSTALRENKPFYLAVTSLPGQAPQYHDASSLAQLWYGKTIYKDPNTNKEPTTVYVFELLKNNLEHFPFKLVAVYQLGIYGEAQKFYQKYKSHQ